MPGKFNHTQLQQTVLNNTGAATSKVIQGPAFGVDVSVIEIGNGQAIALTSDPLSFIPGLGVQESAWLSVHLMANDMATTGFAPMYAQMVLNLNEGMTSQEVADYWLHIHEYCKRINVSITGGHTGIVHNQSTTISGGGTMMLTAPVERILTSAKARAGDRIVIAGCCAMSAAAILAMSFPHHVQNAIGKEQWSAACEMFFQTSTLDVALIAAKPFDGHYAVHAMHDVTEGGVLGAVVEMATAAGLGVVVDDGSLPRNRVTKAVCNLFNLDQRFVIGAGATIIAVADDYASELMDRLHAAGKEAAIAGKFTTEKEQLWMLDDQIKPLPYFDTDPYWLAFSEALNKGLS